MKYAAADQLQPADQQLIPQALQLIKGDPLRSFRIEVAADSLIQLDEQQTKQDRMEFLNAMGGFVNQMLPVMQNAPQYAPMMIELMKFGVGAFKQARQLEGMIDQVIEHAKQQPPQNKPDPEMAKIQAQQQAEQARMQADAQIKQMEMQADSQLEQQKLQSEQVAEGKRLEFDKWKAELEAATKLMIARISANPGIDIPTQDLQTAAVADMGDKLQSAIDRMGEIHASVVGSHAQTMGQIQNAMQALHAPKRIVRGPDGRAVGVEVVRGIN